MIDPAQYLLQAFDSGGQIAPLTEGDPEFDQAHGYRLAAELTQRRIARGETPVGRKIGFTNRNLWADFGVDEPIWGWMYDSTVHVVPADGPISLGKVAEPLIEPEIAFGFGRAPTPGLSIAELSACIDWASHGVEIVTSIYPRWKVKAPDCIAGFGMHHSFWHGPQVPMAELGGPEAFEKFSLVLSNSDCDRHEGHAMDVLDGPLHALKHLIELLDSTRAKPIAAGEIITTGSLTSARPIAPGQRWQTELHGLALPGVSVEFA